MAEDQEFNTSLIRLSQQNKTQTAWEEERDSETEKGVSQGDGAWGVRSCGHTATALPFHRRDSSPVTR